LQEQLGYAYLAAHNLNHQTNNAQGCVKSPQRACAIFLSALIWAWSVACAQTGTSIVDKAASSHDIRQRLIKDYESATNSFAGDKLLAVAVSYAVEGSFDKAKGVYRHVLVDRPGNTRALRGLGTICGLEGDYSKSIHYLNKAWTLGDTDSLQPLAVSCLRAKEYDRIANLLPDLVKRRNEDIGIVNCLLGYALSTDPPNESLLLEALDGVQDKHILDDADTTQLLGDAVNRLKTEELNNKTYQAILRKIVRGYQANTNHWPRARLLAVGEAYSGLMDRSNAESIYNQILKEDPANGSALLGLGIVNLYQHQPVKAINHLRRALKHGQKDALHNLGAAYVMAGDYAGMKDLVPDFLAHKDENRENLNTLLAYSIKIRPPDKDLFYKAIEGLTDGQILRREDTTDAVVIGLRLFGDKKRAQHLMELKARQKKGFGA
jgi:tetratricopeptide (TPR) repeat protein